MDGIIPFALLQGVQTMVSDLGSGFDVKGIVSTSDALPSTGEVGDVYLVSSEGYTRYTWDDTLGEWKPMLNDVATAEDLQSALYS